MATNARATEGGKEGMNLYLCTYDLQEAGLYVAAESRGKAKSMNGKITERRTAIPAKLWKLPECGIVRRSKEWIG